MIDLQAVDEALYAALKAGNAVAGGRVYDYSDPTRALKEPDNLRGAPLPYLEIAETVDIDDDTQGDGDGLTPSDGIEHTVTLRAWSRNRGLKELRLISNEVRSVLHRRKLTVDGLASCICFVEGGPTVKDPDGVSQQMNIRVRMICRS